MIPIYSVVLVFAAASHFLSYGGHRRFEFKSSRVDAQIVASVDVSDMRVRFVYKLILAMLVPACS